MCVCVFVGLHLWIGACVGGWVCCDVDGCGVVAVVVVARAACCLSVCLPACLPACLLVSISPLDPRQLPSVAVGDARRYVQSTHEALAAIVQHWPSRLREEPRLEHIVPLLLRDAQQRRALRFRVYCFCFAFSRIFHLSNHDNSPP
jgi:hypothetical protein